MIFHKAKPAYAVPKKFITQIQWHFRNKYIIYTHPIHVLRHKLTGTYIFGGGVAFDGGIRFDFKCVVVIIRFVVAAVVVGSAGGGRSGTNIFTVERNANVIPAHSCGILYQNVYLQKKKRTKRKAIHIRKLMYKQ